jgi:hypothetical protein
MIGHADPRHEPTPNSNLRKTVPDRETEAAERRENMAGAAHSFRVFSGVKVVAPPQLRKLFVSRFESFRKSKGNLGGFVRLRTAFGPQSCLLTGQPCTIFIAA